MILPVIAIINVLFISSSWGWSMPQEDFDSFIYPICFKSNPNNAPEVNGQEKPLANTLENFIALAEKFELANPGTDLQDELFYFIRNYTFPNIEFNKIGDITPWKPAQSDYTNIENMWEPDDTIREKTPPVADPFTDDEKCSLFTMISHSIIRKGRKEDVQKSAFKPYLKELLNGTEIIGSQLKPGKSANRANNEIVVDHDQFYPMEQGVVAVQGTADAVELGRILMGLYTGLKDYRLRAKDILDIKPSLGNNQIIKEKLASIAEKRVDPVYALTMAEVIAIANWRPEAGARQNLARNGWWVSMPIKSDIDTRDVCPMVYRLPDATEHALSYSSLRGAADGLILGRIVREIKSKKTDIKLSQILRQYYTLHGFTAKTSESAEIHASFCNRPQLMDSWREMIKDQVNFFIYLASKSFNNINDILSYTERQFDSAMDALKNYDEVSKKYCESKVAIEKPEDLPLESPLDVIVVLNAGATEENFKKQQLIIGTLAKKMKLSHSGSRMTIFTDQRHSPSVSESGVIYLKKIVDDTYSSACGACSVTQIERDTRDICPTDEVIIALNQYLVRKEENETESSGVNGKVIVLFNFETDYPKAGRPSQEQVKLEKALKDLHLRHRDVSIYSLGNTIEVLRIYNKGDTAFVITPLDEKEDIIGEQLYSKIVSAPAKLQYNDCIKAQNEKSAVYEGFVTPFGNQHWAMLPKYFYKSFNYKLVFETFNGAAKVCYNRDTKKPEMEEKNCHPVSPGSPLIFPDSNPCKGFTDISCSPFYFSIIGVGKNSTKSSSISAVSEYCDDKNTNNKCQRMDQVKFKISHDGIRCSGSIGLIATPIFLLLAFIVSQVLSK